MQSASSSDNSPARKKRRVKVRVASENKDGNSSSKTHSPAISDSENSENKSRNKEKVKLLIKNVQIKKDKIEEIEERQGQITEKINLLKKEVYRWMEQTGQEKPLEWNNRKIHAKQRGKIKRTEVADILETVRELYTEELLEKVSLELERLRVEKYDGQYDIRFLESKPQKAGKKRTIKSSETNNNVNKKKPSLIL